MPPASFLAIRRRGDGCWPRVVAPLVVALAVLAPGAGAGLARAAGDAIVRSPEHQYQLALGGAWRAVPVPPDSLAPQTSFEHRATGAILTISRVDYPNPQAWNRRTVAQYAEEVEQGVRAAVRGYRRLDRRVHRLGVVPALDLEFRHQHGQGGEIVVMRFLFFRRYSLSAMVAAPARTLRRERRHYREVVTGFAPYFAD